MGLLIVYLTLALGVSFLCSLLEASLLSVPAGHMAIMIEQGQPAGRILEKLKANIDRPFAAILTLNTIAHTVGAAGVGAQALIIWGEQWVAVVSAVLTLLILLLSEIIPKTLGAVHARQLAGFTTWTVRGMIFLLYPFVRLCDGLVHLISRNSGQPILTRREMSAVAEIGRRHGTLSERETRVIQNLLMLQDVQVKDILTPRLVVYALDADTRIGSLVGEDRPIRFARIPIYRGDMDNLVGQVHRFDIIEAYRRGNAQATLESLARSIHAVPETAGLSEALEQFIKRQEQLFYVVDEYGGTEGIVTLEDVVETLLGVEIVDETDTIDDRRRLARRFAQRRHRQYDLETRPDSEDVSD